MFYFRTTWKKKSRAPGVLKESRARGVLFKKERNKNLRTHGVSF